MMVSNEGIITTFGTTGTLGWLDDGTDKMHTGLIKALWQTATGSRVVSSGTLTQSGARFTLATPVVYRTEGSKVTLAGNNYVDIDDGYTDNDRYDLIYIDAGSDALAVSKGADLATPQVKDINKDDVPVAIVKVTSGSTAASSTYEFQVLMSTFDKDELNDDEVTYAKLQDTSSGDVILGKGTGAGTIEEITCTATARTLLDDTSTTAMRTTLGLGTAATSSSSDFLQVASNFTDVADKSAAYKRLVGNATLTALGSGLVGTDEVLIRDVSESNVEVKPKTVTAQTIADLYVEDDTLDDVTGRGATTGNNITVGNATMNTATINTKLNLSKIGALDANADVIVQYIDASQNTPAHQYTLPAASTVDGSVYIIKNLNGSNTMNIVPAGSDVFENNVVSTDTRYVSATNLALKPLRSVMLQAITDSIIIPLVPTPSSLASGWMILETDSDTDTGIANVADDTTPQLGGNLDVNGNKITSASNGDVEIEPNGTGDIILDADVTVDKAHSFLAAKLPTATKTTSTLSDSDAGKYLFVSTASQTITLPASPVAGEHYTILANGHDVTLSSSDNMNGSSSDITIVAYSGVTCISDGTNWIVLGA